MNLTRSGVILLSALPVALLLCIAFVGAIIVLLINRKTRLPAAILLVAGILSVVILVGFAAWTSLDPAQNRMSAQTGVRIQYPAPRKGAPSALPAPKPPARSGEKVTPTAEKTEQQIAQEAADRAAAVVRATLCSLGRVMMDPEQALADGKGPHPSPLPKGEGTIARNPSPLPINPRSVPSEGTIAVSTRPEWVDASPHVLSTSGSGGVNDVYQMSISVGPYTSRAECEEKLPDELRRAVARYGELCLGQTVAPVRLPPDALRQLIKAQWEETRQYSVGPMTHLHVLLQFDRQIKDRVLDEYRRAVVDGRLKKIGGFLVAGLTLVTVAFGYLKIDLATGGAYRGRLRIVAAVAVLTLIVAAVAAIA